MISVNDMKPVIILGVFLLCSAGADRATLAPGSYQIDRCSLEVDAGLIYLWPIGKKDSNSPRWQYFQTLAPQLDTHLYSFDPCYPFNQGHCKNSYVCMADENKENDMSLGHTEGTFIYQADNYVIQYKGGPLEDGEYSLTTNVVLKCQPGELQDAIEVIGNISNDVYLINMKSHCCCPGGCSPDVEPSSSSKLSFGSILCITFVCLLFVYLVGGMIYMKFVRGARGSEIIPNVEFWVDLPNLVMDGVVFVFTCGKGNTGPEGTATGSKQTAYDSI